MKPSPLLSDERRLEDLLALSLGIMSGENGRELYERYRDAVEQVTPYDMVKLEDRQLQMGISPAEIKKDIDKVINLLFKGLRNYPWKKPAEGSFLYYLMLENQAFTFRLNCVKKIIKAYKGREETDLSALREELWPHFEAFTVFEAHYAKKENVLFPFLEKHWTNYRPLKVMWSLHDDIRRKLKELLVMLQGQDTPWAELNKALGAYYFLVFGMIQKEDLVVYPMATETLPEEDWQEMHHQSFEYAFPFIEAPLPPRERETPGSSPVEGFGKDGEELLFKSETGVLSFEQVLLLINTLPLDITFVDENDKVRFFSRPADRYFARSPAIIGRDVGNCHPPESLHVVERIIEAFRKGEKDQADFWLNLKGKFILIRYFALRNARGEYKGVLEVSQDATRIRSLQGEQRLLNWD